MVTIAEVVVGTAGADSFMLHDAPGDNETEPRRDDKRPPQVGYTVRIGHRVIPAPGYAPDDAKGTVNSIVPG